MTSSPEFDFDAAVVGAGAVGLACGYFLALGGKSVVVLEKERLIGQGTSSRNSEVIHAGLYYPTGSLKAELCVRGRRLLYPFLQAHGVGFDKCGKIVVATDDDEIEHVHAVAKQAQINGVEGLKLLTAEAQSVAGPILEIGNTNRRYRFSIGARNFISQWNVSGPAHHCAVGIGHIANKLEKLAALLGIECVRVC